MNFVIYSKELFKLGIYDNITILIQYNNRENLHIYTIYFNKCIAHTTLTNRMRFTSNNNNINNVMQMKHMEM